MKWNFKIHKQFSSVFVSKPVSKKLLIFALTEKTLHVENYFARQATCQAHHLKIIIMAFRNSSVQPPPSSTFIGSRLEGLFQNRSQTCSNFRSAIRIELRQAFPKRLITCALLFENWNSHACTFKIWPQSRSGSFPRTNFSLSLSELTNIVTTSQF